MFFLENLDTYHIKWTRMIRPFCVINIFNYSQFPTYDGVHIFPDFLSNWGQTIILVYLFWALYIDLIPEEDKKEYKKFHNKFTQLTVVQEKVQFYNMTKVREKNLDQKKLGPKNGLNYIFELKIDLLFLSKISTRPVSSQLQKDGNFKFNQ